MKELYIDIMEKTVRVYGKARIDRYINEVERDGLTEHGFPRLAANLAIVISFGRCTELYLEMVKMLDICCAEMPKKKAANDFSVREIVCALRVIEKKGTVEKERLDRWKGELAELDPYRAYTVIPAPFESKGNWAAFGAASEIARSRFCGGDSAEFIDNQISSLLGDFDENDMYKDPNNPILYDYMTRVVLAFAMHEGYNGKYAEEVRKKLKHVSDISLKMQTVTGEMPFGGRSNQFLFNQSVLAAAYEYDAAEYKKEGDIKKAGECRAAAKLAVDDLMNWLGRETVSHIKNGYPVDEMVGCEEYGYFNKYMITLASNAYLAYLFADDSVVPTEAPCKTGGYFVETSSDFHKVILNKCGYYFEFDTNADTHYDANGLGKVQKADCTICLSVPFPAPEAKYKPEKENVRPMSLCVYAETDSGTVYGSEAEYSEFESEQNNDEMTAVFGRIFGGCKVKETYKISRNGIDITAESDAAVGFMIPVFEFDGCKYSDICVGENAIEAEYAGSICRYKFDAKAEEFEYYFNRNGRYRVYKIPCGALHIEICRK